MDDATYTQESTLIKEYKKKLLREEMFWHQKSREIWLKEVDRNTKFFHIFVKGKRALNKIHTIQVADGEIITDQNRIFNEVVRYFSEVLRKDKSLDARDNELVEVIPKLITADMNMHLVNQSRKRK